MDSIPASELLRQEASLIAHYLLGSQPSPGIVDRYVAGATRCFGSDITQSDRELLSFVRRHPATLPFFDAASALFNPKSQLRKRILLMVAILETTPEYCSNFFAEPFSKTEFIVRSFLIALTTAVQAAVGLVLNLWIRIR